MAYFPNSGYGFRVRGIVHQRNILVLLIFLYIILEALVLAACTTKSVANYYLTSITYYAISSNNVPIQKLQLHMGYFSSCIRVNEESWSCGINAYQMLLASPDMDTSNQSCVDLYNLLVTSADLIRSRCLTPYILLLSVIFAFLVLVMIAFVRPTSSINHYYFMLISSYVGLTLSVVASVWQETNIKTANMLLTQIVDNYYQLQTSYGSYCRAAIWIGTAFQIIITATCLFKVMNNSILDRYWSWNGVRY